MASEKYITLSDLWPVYQKLLSMYSPLSSNNDFFINNDYNDIFTQTSNKEKDTNGKEIEEDTSETNSLSQALDHVEKLVVTNILVVLTKRYSNNQNVMRLLQKASFLDPRHRNKYLGD
jgi:hypothetical protein